MVFKDLFNAITGKKDESQVSDQVMPVLPTLSSDQFPAYRAAEVDTRRYQKIPLSGIAALGASFSQLPASARTIVSTVTKQIATKETLFIGINPKNVAGFLLENEHGTVGNIMQYNPQGKRIIAGRMRFKALDGGLPVTETSLTTMPFNPTSMAVAAALMSVEQKLSDIQKSVDEILQFIKLDKQSKQRGNLNMLSEILEEYKQKHQDKDLRKLRSVAVQDIKRESHQDILFYQEQIARQLKEQDAIHLSQQTQGMLDAIMGEFYEYQLACYLYAYSSFLDAVLQHDYSSATLEAAAKRMQGFSARYGELYQSCRTQIAKHQQSSIDTQLLGGIGSIAKNLGNLASNVPVFRSIQVDATLSNAGQALDKQNEKALQDKLDKFAPLEQSRMQPFIENVRRIDVLHNMEKSMLLDGDNLYVLEAE